MTGSEGSYTFGDIAAGAGAESAALRVTLATESLAALETIELGATTLAALETIELGATSLAALESLTTIDAVTTVGTITNAVTVVGSAAEDAAASGNPVLIGGRYDSSARTLETGDVGAIALNASGQVLVEIAAGAGSGGTAAADDADFTAGTTSGTPVMGSYQSSPTAVTDGDMGIIGITANREVKVSVTSGGVSGIAEDTASAGGEEGIAILAVRRDAASSGVSADGDFAFLSVDSSGNLRTTGSSGVTSYTEDGASAGGESLVLMGAVRRDTAASSSGTDGDYSTLNTDASGRLHVNVGALPASTNTIEMVGDVAQDAAVAGNPVLIGGRASTATPTAMSADGDSVYQWLTRTGAAVVSGDLVDDAAFTPGTSRVQAIGYAADETATDSVDEGDIGAARMTLDRKQIVTPYAHAAAGGHTPYKNLDVDESEDEVKGSGGKIFWLHAINLANAKRYLKIYNNTAAGTTVGTTVPDLTFPLPTMGDTNGAGFTIHFGEHGIALGTGITVAATTGFADNDTGAPGANEVIINLGYL